MFSYPQSILRIITPLRPGLGWFSLVPLQMFAKACRDKQISVTKMMTKHSRMISCVGNLFLPKYNSPSK